MEKGSRESSRLRAKLDSIGREYPRLQKDLLEIAKMSTVQALDIPGQRLGKVARDLDDLACKEGTFLHIDMQESLTASYYARKFQIMKEGKSEAEAKHVAANSLRRSIGNVICRAALAEKFGFNGENYLQIITLPAFKDTLKAFRHMMTRTIGFRKQ